MKRREVITLLGGAAVWPLTARAQQQQRRAARIGYLSAASAPDVNIESFKEGMRRFGYVEDRDFIIEVRYAERNFARFPTLIEDLLRARVELIVTAGPRPRRHQSWPARCRWCSASVEIRSMQASLQASRGVCQRHRCFVSRT
jgi:hypothetical protein